MDSLNKQNEIPSPIYKPDGAQGSIRKNALTEIPLSFAQERLWFLDQLDPDNAAHNISTGLKFNGPLDIDVLEESINRMIERHEILRTVFGTQNDRRIAQVLPELIVPLQQIDFRELNATEQQKKIQDFITTDLETGFSLSSPPLIRFTLLFAGNEEYILLITAHQIILDKTSLMHLITELSKFYSSFSSNEHTGIQPVESQFTYYSSRQRQWIHTEQAKKELNYWKKHLEGIPDVLPLPTDRSRPAIQNFAASFITSELDCTQTIELKSLCDEEDASLLMGLLSAFSILIHRYTGEEDILIGYPMTTRPREQIQSTIGPYTNTVVMRVKLSGNPTFRELLQRVRKEFLEVLTNQNIPFEKLVQELQPNRSLSHSPLFQVMFSMEENPAENYEFSNLQVQKMEIENPGQKVDLTLNVKEEHEKLRLVWKYSTDLFDQQRIEKMSEHFSTLTTSIINNFDQKVSQLNLLTDEEKRHLIYELNQTRSTYPRDSRIEELFQASVDASPQSIAVVFGSEQLSYEELDQKSNQLARYLMRKGLGPGKIGALFLDRTLELPVALLSILKTGACCLPIDPEYLSDRVQFMLTDSGASLIVSQESIAGKLQKSCPIIHLDSERKSIEEEDRNRFPIQGNSNDLAYIIYTSGSTGIPKGVQVMHRNLVNDAFAIIKACGFTANDRMLQNASIAFDQAAEELYPSWFVGGTVILRNDEMMSSFLEFLRQIEYHKITVLNLPTTYWHELTQEIQACSLPIPSCIRILIVGTEKATFATYKQWLQLAGDTPLFFNAYGPTETTVTSTIYDDQKDRMISEKVEDVPIGRPISNAQIYILDKHFQLVPKGVPGELYIGGDGVSRGYLNQPELTETKFPINPFLKNSEERIYRTGDIVRYLPDGNLQFLGRIDNQVKIRGYRIELGEVESAVSMHEAVLQSVVLAPIVAERKQLVAYVVPRDKSLTPETLKDFLKIKIPGYMIPQIYVFVNQFPMTASGKVDKQALPIPREVDLKRSYVAPRNELETQLTEIWQQILKVSKIGVHDNFFDLGGHSLLALRLFTQIEKVIGKALPLATLFQAPTIEQLANVLREERWNSLWSPLVTIQPYGNKPPFFFIHAVRGNVIGYRPIAHHLDPNQPVYGLQARGLDGIQQPHVKVEEMASDYIGYIRSVRSKGPYHLGGHSSGGLLAFEIARQLSESGEQVGIVALLDTDCPDIKPEDRLDQYAMLTKVYWERIRYHLKNILFKSGRVAYIKRVLKRLRRRVRVSASLAYNQFLKITTSTDNTSNLRVEEAGHKAIHDYVPGYYHGEITLFVAEKRSVGEPIQPEIGWKPFASSLRVIRIPGNHLNIMRVPNVQVLAELLQEQLDQYSEKKHNLQNVVKGSLLSFVYHVLENSLL